MDARLHALHLARIVTLHEEGRVEGHSERTEEIMRSVLSVLSEAQNLPEEVQAWPLAMLPHDIGKLVIPSQVLRKPGKLDPFERALIIQHTIEGRDQLNWLADQAAFAGDRHAASFWRVAGYIAGGHHERLDGQGYPLGLSGGAVPLVLRIARLVDVYEALTARRSYRDSMPHEQAMRVMRFEEGGFDDSLLEALDEAMTHRRVSAD